MTRKGFLSTVAAVFGAAPVVVKAAPAKVAEAAVLKFPQGSFISGIAFSYTPDYLHPKYYSTSGRRYETKGPV